jgi:hypothetical protein
MQKDRLLFTVARKDLEIEFFRAGGKGGQKQNKTSSACRIRHRASGAVGESREERYQHMNRKIALQRLADSKEFRRWAKVHAAVIEEGHRDVEEKVSQMLRPINLRVEYVVTYTCNDCGRQAKVTQLEGEPLVLPAGWAAIGKDDHSCERCAQRS